MIFDDDVRYFQFQNFGNAKIFNRSEHKMHFK